MLLAPRYVLHQVALISMHFIVKDYSRLDQPSNKESSSLLDVCHTCIEEVERWQ